MDPDGEERRLVRRILDDVFLFGHPEKEAGTVTGCDLFFDVVGRQHAFQVTDGVIAEGIRVVAQNQGIRLGLNQAGFVDNDREADALVFFLL